MRITKLSINNLFGIFNHTIPLNLTEHITIIHGPNGFGKTILLKMLDGLFNRSYSEIRNIPFREFVIEFENKDKINISKTIQSGRNLGKQVSLFAQEEMKSGKNVYASVELEYKKPNSKKPRSFSIGTNGERLERNLPLGILEDIIDPIRQIGPHEWIDRQTGNLLSLNDVIDKYGHHLSKIKGINLFREPNWWIEILKSLEIHLIESQRLFNIEHKSSYKKGPQMVPAVTIYADELAETIQQKLAESATLSQSLDRTFPARLVEQMGKSKSTEGELRKKLSDFEKQRAKLKEVGLLDKEEGVGFLPNEKITGNTKDVLAVYVQDVEQKLGIFDGIANKIQLFKSIIENRFLYKKIIFSKENGFSFATLDEEPLPLQKLSSGEQHELVLLYELLFKVKPNSLILIDEPELSLHVAWQKQFLKDLEKITKLSLFDVLIATHSPQIIHDRWDLTVDLKGPEK